ncbi:hypothetical protein ABPG73_016999 [Tetrahymena malaccensis]
MMNKSRINQNAYIVFTGSKIKATEYESFKEESIQYVKIFLKELKDQVFELIEQKENDLLQIVEQKSNTKAKILEEYNQLSQKERLKDIILNHYQDFESQDKQLKDLVIENKLNQQKNKDRLEDILKTQKPFKIDMTPYKEIKGQLIGFINCINSNIQNSLNIQQISKKVVQESKILTSSRNFLEVSKVKDLANCKNYEHIKMNFKKNKIKKQMIEIDKIKSNLSSTDQFLIENYKKCSIHSKKQLVMVRVDDEQEQNQLECLHCVYKQQNKQYLPLELIIDSNEQTIFKGWPVFDDSQIYEKLLEATKQESFKEQNKQDVKIFFKELKAQVFALIEQKENELLQIVEQKSNTNQYFGRIQLIILKGKTQRHNTQQILRFRKLRQNAKRPSQREQDELTQKQGQIRKYIENLKTIQDRYEFIQGNKRQFNWDYQQYQFQYQKKLKYLTDIQASNNNIKTKGAIYIQNIVERLSNISNLSINLNGNSIGFDGAKNYADFLKKCLNIRDLKLRLYYNQINDEGVKLIVSALELNQNITKVYIDFTGNQISEIAKSNLKKALESQISKLELNI